MQHLADALLALRTGRCFEEMEKVRSNMKCLFIQASYDTGFILPIELLDVLYEFKIVTGELYNMNLKFSDKRMDIRVIDYDDIKPQEPDTKVLLDKMQAHKAKLQKELEEIDSEINKL